MSLFAEPAALFSSAFWSDDGAALCIRRRNVIGWLFLVIFAALSFFYSWWFLFGVGVVALWKLNRWYFYSSRPWKKVHYPMMRAYAGACGLETARAEREERSFNVKAALQELLRSVNPKLGIGHNELIERELERCQTFYDEPLIRRHLTESKGIPADKTAPFIEAVRKTMSPSDNGLIVRMVIASVIEEQFSPQDRGEYLFEVFSGSAK